MHTPSHLTDFSPGRGALPPRARLESDAPSLNLTGTWDFRLHEVADPGIPPWQDSSDAPWEKLAIPCHWVLAGEGRYGRPIYTNIRYPFPVDPPSVPDANPTGDHRLEFTLPAGGGWDDADRVLLRFDGVESAYQVWLNGSEVGVGKGSRLVHEFDVTDHLHPGENTLAVRVHQFSDASYLEDQDQWWLPGIFRDVTLLARPAGGVHDVWLQAAYDHVTGDGQLTTELDVGPESYPVRLEIPELGVSTVWESPADVAALDVGAVEPWSAEDPRRYDVLIHSQGEQVRLLTGFRSVRITGNQFTVNGRKVMFHGVNRHEIEASRGRVFDLEHARDDLVIMKRHNVNAIRTSHYPPHPLLLDLADELGFWVVDECDLETHGFYLHGWDTTPGDAPADDPRWREAHLDRMRRTVERDKNHPSIVMWSLGNETGTGQNLLAMAQWVRQRDGGRPLHYEGDYWGQYSDVYSRMYTSVEGLDAIGGDSGPIAYCSPGQAARQRAKPFILCEYVHAMGNGPGGIADYQQTFRQYANMHGGFVWEWRDHGLLTTDESGTEFYAYGGDFGEEIHDGNFVADGLLLSDGTPSPGLHEFAAVVAPVYAELQGTRDHRTVTLVNERHWTDTSDLTVTWSVELDGEQTAEGVLEISPVAAGDTGETPLPPEVMHALTEAAQASTGWQEAWLQVSVTLREPTSWAEAGHVVSVRQFDVGSLPETAHRAAPPEPVPAGGTAAPQESDGIVTLGDARISATTGRLISVHGLALDGPQLELWRAPTDNDRGAGSASYVHPGPGEASAGLGRPLAEQWEARGLDRLQHRVLSVESGSDRVVVTTRSVPAAARHGVDTTVTYLWSAEDELIMHVAMAPVGPWVGSWPRIGIRLDLPGHLEQASWFGHGPHEAYPDSMSAALMGRYSSTIDALSVNYPRPQETGHRPGMRWLKLSDAAGQGVTVRTLPEGPRRVQTAESGSGVGFTALRHTAQQLGEALHPHELPPADTVHLYLDAAQHGLGSGSCGPGARPEAQLWPGSSGFTLALRAPDTETTDTQKGTHGA